MTAPVSAWTYARGASHSLRLEVAPARGLPIPGSLGPQAVTFRTQALETLIRLGWTWAVPLLGTVRSGGGSEGTQNRFGGVGAWRGLPPNSPSPTSVQVSPPFAVPICSASLSTVGFQHQAEARSLYSRSVDKIYIEEA